MSDYCGSCAYDVKERIGEKACPFNILYWNFLIENHARLAGNPRMAIPYRTLENMNAERRTEITREALAFLEDGNKRQEPNQFALDL